MDQSKNSVVDLIHIFDNRNFNSGNTINNSKITIVKDTDNQERFYLVKKGEELDPTTNKYLFINHCEKSFELLHPSVLNLSGYYTQKPYLFYKCLDFPKTIDQVELSNENIQIIFLGIASGLSYLISKGFYYDNFSISSIIFEDLYPKLIDYINVENSEKNDEDIIVNYVDIINYIIDMKKREDPNIIINDELQNMINRTQQRKNIPTLNDFISFLKSKSFLRTSFLSNEIKNFLFKDYVKNIGYDNIILCSTETKYKYPDKSIERIFYEIYKNDRNIIEEKYLFNLFPEPYINSFISFLQCIQKKEYFDYEDSKFFNHNSSPFTLYKALMKEISDLNSKINNSIDFYKERKSIETKICALRFKAIYCLKQATKKEEEKVKSKIELAMQYINGNILPCNLEKSKVILSEITDQKQQKLINQIKEKIELTKQSNEKKLSNLPPDKKEIIQKAENGDVLCMLYAGFSLYTGFDGFPILHSESIKYYRKASKISPSAMTLLGYLYLKGIIFPQNFNRAKNCFQKAADKGDMKAGIIDSLLRKHAWRTYMLDFDVDTIFHHYLPSFESMISNDAFAFPKLVYNINNIYTCEINKVKNKLHSERDHENYSMSIVSKLSDLTDSDFEKCHRIFSQKIVLSLDNIEETNDVDEQMKLAKSYFYGINGYPVNYSKAINLFKKAADNNNSEAQWFYALMCYSKLGTNDNDNTMIYLKKSSAQNNLKGKLLLAMYFKICNNDYMFEKYIQECCKSQSPEAMYFYGMYLENNESDSYKSKSYYQQSADLGNFYSLIRLIYLIKYLLKIKKTDKKLIELYKKYMNFSVSIFNESLLIKAIIFNDRCKNFDQSNILIQIGMKINYQLFTAFYADHLLYGKGMEVDEGKAERIAFLAFDDEYPNIYFERYVYIMLEKFMRKKQHKEAVDFLINHKNCLTERFRRKYLFFYRKLDKNIAHDNFITVNFLNKNYQICFDKLMNIKTNENKNNRLKLISDLKSEIVKNNPFAMAILGKAYKKGKFVLRNLKEAVKLFALSAQNKCPEGYYYLGKEFYYGRILDQDVYLAEKYLLKAFNNYGEPKAGYYLYKIKKVTYNGYLKISAYFGYRKALYKYGRYLIKCKTDEMIGKKLIQQAALQNHKKAKMYCKLHNEKCDQNDSDLINNLKYNYNIISHKITGEFDDESENEQITNLINIIKSKKNNQNNSSDDDNNDNDNNDNDNNDNDNNDNDNNDNDNNDNDNNYDDDENILNVIQMINKDSKSAHIMHNVNIGDNDNKLALKDLKKNKKSMNKIGIDDIDNFESKDLKKNKKSSNKIDINDNDDFDLKDLKKNKKSSNKIDINDNDDFDIKNLKNNKKSSNKIDINDNDDFELKDLIGGKKSSYKIDINDNNDFDLKDLKNNKKSSNKIDIDDNDDFELKDLIGGKKSSYKIGIEDIENSTTKKKKVSYEIDIDDDNDNFTLKDLKIDKKRSQISSDSEDVDISDLISFWK